MLLTLLFLTQVSGEWVEISQQHYQKPLRPTHNYPSLNKEGKVSDAERATRPNRIYINQSLPEYNWNKGTAYNVPRDVSVNQKPVSSTVTPLQENKTKSASKTPVRKDALINGDIDNGPINIPKREVKNDRILNEEKLKDAGFYPKLSHTGNMRRIYLTSTSTEIPPRRIEPQKYDDRPIEVLNLSDLEYVTEDDGFTTVEVDEGFNLGKKDDQRISNTADIPKVFVKDKSDRNHIRPNEKSTKNDFENYASDSELKNTGNVPSEENVEYNNRNVAVTGNIKRVQMTHGTTEKTTRIIEHVKNHEETSKVTIAPKSAVVREEIFKDDKGLGNSVHRFPIVGKVKRVELVRSTAKPLKRTSVIRHRYDNYTHTDATTIRLPEQMKEDAYRDNQSKIEEMVQRASNKGKIKEFLYTSLTETDYAAKTDRDKLKNKESIKRLTVPNPEDVMIEELLMIDEEQLQGKIHKGLYNSIGKKVQHISGTDETTTKIYIFNENRPKNNELVISTHPEFVTEDQTFINYEELGTHIYKITNDKQMERLKAANENISLLTTVDVKPEKKIVENIPTTNDENKTYEYNSFGTIKVDKEALHNPEPEFTTKESIHNIVNFENFVTSAASGERKLENNEIKTKLPHADHSENINLSNKDNSKQNKSDFKQETKSEVNFNYTKENTMENVVRLIKVVADTISRNTQKNFNSKMRYLEELKDAILANIENRLESEFPDDPTGPRRNTRAAPESRGHVEIPSSESALMTISFLTFAVFLIKLVLQLIQTYKNKTMMMPAVVAAVGRGTSAFREYRSHH